MFHSKIKWPVKARSIKFYNKIYTVAELANYHEVTKKTIFEYLLLAEVIKDVPKLVNFNKKEALKIVRGCITIEEIEEELRKRGQKIPKRNYDQRHWTIRY